MISCGSQCRKINARDSNQQYRPHRVPGFCSHVCTCSLLTPAPALQLEDMTSPAVPAVLLPAHASLLLLLLLLYSQKFCCRQLPWLLNLLQVVPHQLRGVGEGKHALKGCPTQEHWIPEHTAQEAAAAQDLSACAKAPGMLRRSTCFLL